MILNARMMEPVKVTPLEWSFSKSRRMDLSAPGCTLSDLIVLECNAML